MAGTVVPIGVDETEPKVILLELMELGEELFSLFRICQTSVHHILVNSNTSRKRGGEKGKEKTGLNLTLAYALSIYSTTYWQAHAPV